MEEKNMNNTKKHETAKPIFSQRLAGLLMFKGHRLVDIKKNLNNPKKNVFYFFETDELNELVADYIKSYCSK
jgi:hypothetical protein